MDSALKIAFDEILRKFDEFDARMEQRFSRALAALEPRGAAIELRIGGFEQSGATQLVVADNWGGLFDEIPAVVHEPVPAPDATFIDLDAPACVTPAATSSMAVSAAVVENVPVKTSPAAFQRQFHELAQADEKKQVAQQEAEHSVFLDVQDSKFPGEIHAASHPGGGRPIPKLVTRLRMRAQRTKTTQRRRPLRRLVWRPPWRLALYGRRPRRRGRRIRNCALRVHEPVPEPIASIAAAASRHDITAHLSDADGLARHMKFALVRHGEASSPLLHVTAAAPRAPDLVLRAPIRDHRSYGDPTVVITFDIDRALLIPLCCVHPAELLNRVDPCVRAHDGLALVAATALPADAVGAAGGGLLACVVAAGSVQTNCSTTGGTDMLVSLPSATLATSSTIIELDTAPAAPNVVATLVPPVVRFQDNPKHVKPKQVATVIITSKSSSTSMDAQVKFDEMQRRYITNLTSASWIGVVLSGSSATKAVDDQTEFEGMSAQVTELLQPLLAIEMSRHACLHLWQHTEPMPLCWNVEHTGCNWELSVHKSSQWNSTSLLSLLNCSSGYAYLLTVRTASCRAQNSLLNERTVVVIAHIDMTAWFIFNLISVLELSKPLATHGLLRIELNWYTTCCIEFQPWPPPSIFHTSIAKFGYDELQMGLPEAQQKQVLELQMQQSWPPLAVLPLRPTPWPSFGRCKMMQLLGACPSLASNSVGLGQIFGTVAIEFLQRSSRSLVPCQVEVMIAVFWHSSLSFRRSQFALVASFKSVGWQVFDRGRCWSLTTTQGWINTKSKLKLEKAFRHLMCTYRKASGSALISCCRPKPLLASQGHSQVVGEQQLSQSFENATCKTPTLISPKILLLLYVIAHRLIQDGNQQSWYRIYRDALSSALELSLQKLGMEQLTEDHMQQWVASNMKIGTWNQYG